MKTTPIRRLAASAAGILLAAGTAQAGTLVINANTSDEAPRKAFEEVIAKFEAENPDVDVQFNVFDHEAFKTAIRNFLSAEAPDVVTWFAGNRMKVFVDRGLFEDISDLWADEGWNETMASARSTVTVGGRQYGVPYGYYQWGIYYRRDLFEQVGVEVPKTWEDFLAAGEKLKAAGITPVTIGTKYLWTAAGWFDYLNLRVNGLDFHMELMEGKASYLDPRVRKVFETWRELIDRGFYVENHASYSWQEAQPFLYQGKAAMYLIGNFLTRAIPEDVVDRIDYFQFPIIDPDVPVAEDAPTDTLHIPARARNKADARRFLAFVGRPDIVGPLAAAQGYLPPRIDAPVADDRFMQAGFEVLSRAAGLAQFYDRDTDPEMAKIGMQGFQEFMVKPDRLDAILERLEKARKRIFRQ